MGLIKFFKNRAVAKKISQSSTDDLNKIVQNFLKKSQLDYNNTLKTAQTLNRASLMDKSTKKLKSELRELLEDDEEEYEEEDEPESDGADKMLMDLVGKFMTNTQNPDATGGIEAALAGMSQEQKNDLVAKFIK